MHWVAGICAALQSGRTHHPRERSHAAAVQYNFLSFNIVSEKHNILSTQTGAHFMNDQVHLYRNSNYCLASRVARDVGDPQAIERR